MITKDCPRRPLPSPGMWHPWRTLRQFPHITVQWRDDLPPGLRAATDGQQIVMSSRLLQRERRVAVTHELEHITRGHTSACQPVDEEHVKQAVAHRLIPLERLAEALQWTRDIEELAEELWVDGDTVRTRLKHLHPSERGYLRRRLEENT